MERLAILSDIHGNMPALEAVIEDVERRGIERMICLGDLVGKGPDSDKAVDRIRSICQTVIRGNWDDFMPKPTDNEIIAWHRARLGQERLDYLRTLPFALEFRMSGKLVRLFHASPRSVYERIQPWDSIDKRMSLLDPSERTPSTELCDVAGYGDIHNAYVQHLSGRLLFNTGSVGNPLDMPQASYAIMEGELDTDEAAPFSLQLVRVPYPVERAIQDAVEADMPDLENYVQELRTGRYRGLNS